MERGIHGHSTPTKDAIFITRGTPFMNYVLLKTKFYEIWLIFMKLILDLILIACFRFSRLYRFYTSCYKLAAFMYVKVLWSLD